MTRASALILCEKRQTWATAWRRAICDERLPLVETRGVEACEAELRDRPGSVAAVEVTLENLERIYAALDRWTREIPHAAVVILGSREMEAAEWTLRSAGAVHAAFSPRKLRSLLPLVRRQLACVPPPPSGTLSWEERLPW